METPKGRAPKTENGADAHRNVYVRTYNYTEWTTPQGWTLACPNSPRLNLNYLLNSVFIFYQVITFFPTELIIKKYCMFSECMIIGNIYSWDYTKIYG